MGKNNKGSKGNKENRENKTGIIVAAVISILATVFIDYLLPTPWNIHSVLCWFKVIIIFVVFWINNMIAVGVTKNLRQSKIAEISTSFILAPIALLVFLIIGAFSGAQLFHSSDYANIIQVEQAETTDGILSEKDAKIIALMDTASATQLGDREIGSIKNFSAFNVASEYIQLNVNGDAVKIAPLEYAGLFKWIKNKDAGVTGYVTVSPTTMTADYVELDEGMMYVPSAYFSKDLNRHIHNQFPTLIYGNTHFEVDEQNQPFYVSSVYEKTIGLFSGEIVTGAIVTNPITGESTYYSLNEVPSWVDDVVDGDLICQLYNVAFKNKNGFWNGTIFGANTGCMQTTTIDSSDEDTDEEVSSTDYGYIAKDGDIYIYTGITSMAKDSSNLGFIMVNERTGEYYYFAVSGANEQSAMHAAEGEVQQYAYKASFPTLINVDNELTYIGVLKDANGLVKMYYMVNVKDYGKVVVATERDECIQLYAKKLGLNPQGDILESASESNAGNKEGENSSQDVEENISFQVSVIQFADVDGNTYVYMGTEDGKVYKALFADNEQLLFVQPNDTIEGTIKNDKVTVKEVVKDVVNEVIKEDAEEAVEEQ